MAVYNTSVLSNATGPTGLAIGVNTMSGGLLGALLLFFIFIVVFAGGKLVNMDSEKAVILSLLSTSFFGALFWFLTLVTWQVGIIPFVLFILLYLVRVIGGE